MVNAAGSMCSSIRSCLKSLIIAINILVLLAGCAALGTGIWIVVDEDSFFTTLYADLVDVVAIDKEYLRHSAIVLASGGAATIFFSLLGIAAAATGSKCLLGLYITVITLVIAVEVAAVILGLVFKTTWERELDSVMVERIKTKYAGEDITSTFSSAVNSLQWDQKCCGWINGSDYEVVGSQWDRQNATVPESCCMMENGTKMDGCTTMPTSNNTYIHQGCKSSLQGMFVNYQGCIIGIAVSIAGLEFFMLILAIVLITTEESNKYNMS